jgi:hypothetical protein
VIEREGRSFVEEVRRPHLSFVVGPLEAAR